MEEELCELRDLVAQLRADNARLQQEQVTAVPGPSAAPSIPEPQLPSTFITPVKELVLVPRDRKCPGFRGRSGIGLEEWVEETQACIRARTCPPLTRPSFFSTIWRERRVKKLLSLRH